MYSLPHGKEDFMAGSIEKRGDNTYRLVYFCGKNLDGSPARHTKTVHCTKKEAKVELAKEMLLRVTLLHLKNLQKYGNEIMALKNLLQQLMQDT